MYISISIDGLKSVGRYRDQNMQSFLNKKVKIEIQRLRHDHTEKEQQYAKWNGQLSSISFILEESGAQWEDRLWTESCSTK